MGTLVVSFDTGLVFRLSLARFLDRFNESISTFVAILNTISNTYIMVVVNSME